MKYQTVRLLAAILTTLTAQSVFSAPVEVSVCYAHAGRDFGIDPDLLLAIGIQESRLNNEAINTGSSDYCQMQINQVHTSELKEFGINLKDLTHKPCTCIYTGTWVLAKLIQRYGTSWNTVGMYNAGVKYTPTAIRNRAIYAKTIRGIYTVIKMESKEGGDKSLALVNEKKPQK